MIVPKHQVNKVTHKAVKNRHLTEMKFYKISVKGNSFSFCGSFTFFPNVGLVAAAFAFPLPPVAAPVATFFIGVDGAAFFVGVVGLRTAAVPEVLAFFAAGGPTVGTAVNWLGNLPPFFRPINSGCIFGRTPPDAIVTCRSNYKTKVIVMNREQLHKSLYRIFY